MPTPKNKLTIDGKELVYSTVPSTGEERWIDFSDSKDFDGTTGYRWYDSAGNRMNYTKYQEADAQESVPTAEEVDSYIRSQGYDPNLTRPMWGLHQMQEQGLQGVYPEFALLSGGRGLFNGALQNTYNAAQPYLTRAFQTMKPGSSFWMNPMTKGMLYGTAMSEGVNLASNLATNGQYDTFGQYLLGAANQGLDAAGVNWQIPQNVWTEMGAEMLNPGWWMNPDKGLTALERAVNAGRNISNETWNAAQDLAKKARKTYDLLYGNGLSRIGKRLEAADLQNKALISSLSRPLYDKHSEIMAKANRAYELRNKALQLDHSGDTGPIIEEANKLNISDVDFSKMSKEDIERLFKKNSTGWEATTPKEAAEMWDPNTGTFKYIQEEQYAGGFDPKKAVELGDKEIKDFRTGEVHNIHLDDSIFNRPSSQVTTEYNPNTKEITKSIDAADIPESPMFPTIPEEYRELVRNNTDYVTNKLLPGSKKFGSTSNIEKGNLYHLTHDADVIMTEKQAMQHPEFKSWYSKRPDTYGWDHPEAGELDINVIREDAIGRAKGDLAHELFAQMHPKEYFEHLISRIENGEKLSTNISLPITADELLKSYDPVTKGIVDAFASDKQKHMGRALYYLHYGDINDVRKGFDMYANYLLGGNYKPTDIPISEFKDVAANSEIIDLLGLKAINKEQFVYSPERMKLLVDYALLDKTFVGRGIDQYRAHDVIEALTQWYANTTNGTARGVGLNTVLGGNSNHGDVYATLIPERMESLEGKDVKSLLKQVEKNIGNRALSSEEKDRVLKLANQYGIPMNNVTTLQDILKNTANKRGDNYKSFINELAELFDRALITNDQYGNGLYASLLEDQPKDAIQQIFLPNMDRPVPSTYRDSNFSSLDNSYYDSTKFSHAKNASYKRAQRIKQRYRDEKTAGEKHFANLHSYEERMYKKRVEVDKKLDEVRKGHGDSLAMLNSKYLTLRNKIKRIKRNIRKGVLATAGIGAAAKGLMIANDNSIGTQLERGIQEGIIQINDNNGNITVLDKDKYARSRRLQKAIEEYNSYFEGAEEKAYGGPLVQQANMFKGGGPKKKLSDKEYYSIMERVAQENNPIWNKSRIKQGERPLSVDEEYLRILNDNTYDYRGFYDNNPVDAANASTHWPDDYKTVYHPTFSIYSKHSRKKSDFNPLGLEGGRWPEGPIEAEEKDFQPAWWQSIPNTYTERWQYEDGGQMNTYKQWQDLPINERADIMKVAIRNGITNLADIKAKYNEFALGGQLEKPNLYGGGGTKNPLSSAYQKLNRINQLQAAGMTPQEAHAMQYYVDRGFAPHQAAGFVGGFVRESALDPTALNKNSGAYGIGQWLGPRKDALMKMYGNNPTFANELDYSMYELDNTTKEAKRRILSSSTPEEAATNAFNYYGAALDGNGVANMNRWGQDGQKSLQQGIDNAKRLYDLYSSVGFSDGGNMYSKGSWLRKKTQAISKATKIPATSKKSAPMSNSSAYAMQYFINKGLAPHQAAGLVGNLMRESGLNPLAINPGSKAYGLAQWLGARKKKLFSMYGNKPTLQNQLDFVWWELNNTHKNGLKYLMAARNAEEAARAGMNWFEFSNGDAISEMNKWGQDGRGSMRKGIEFATELAGQPMPDLAYLDTPNPNMQQSQTYGQIPMGYEYSMQQPQNDNNTFLVFEPSNPQAFFAPLSSYETPVEQTSTQPLVDAAEQQYKAEMAERQRVMQQNNNMLALVSYLNNSSNQDSSPFGVFNLLSGSQIEV